MQCYMLINSRKNKIPKEEGWDGGRKQKVRELIGPRQRKGAAGQCPGQIVAGQLKQDQNQDVPDSAEMKVVDLGR